MRSLVTRHLARQLFGRHLPRFGQARSMAYYPIGEVPISILSPCIVEKFNKIWKYFFILDFSNPSVLESLNRKINFFYSLYT